MLLSELSAFLSAVFLSTRISSVFEVIIKVGLQFGGCEKISKSYWDIWTCIKHFYNWNNTLLTQWLVIKWSHRKSTFIAYIRIYIYNLDFEFINNYLDFSPNLGCSGSTPHIALYQLYGIVKWVNICFKG